MTTPPSKTCAHKNFTEHAVPSARPLDFLPPAGACGRAFGRRLLRCVQRSGRFAHASARTFASGLGFVTRFADRLQVAFGVGTAIGLGDDVIDCHSDGNSPLLQARLAQAAVTLQDAITQLRPPGAITTLVTVTALSIIRPTDLVLGVLGTVTRLGDQLTTARMPAWCRSLTRHCAVRAESTQQPPRESPACAP